jgi:hypothetical protein
MPKDQYGNNLPYIDIFGSTDRYKLLTNLGLVHGKDFDILSGIHFPVLDYKMAAYTLLLHYLRNDAKADKNLTINQQAGAYSLQLSDNGKLIEMSGGGNLTVLEDESANLPIGSQITILQTGASQVTLVGSGATINSTPGLKLRAQWSSATLIKRAANTWVAIGDLVA